MAAREHPEAPRRQGRVILEVEGRGEPGQSSRTMDTTRASGSSTPLLKRKRICRRPLISDADESIASSQPAGGAPVTMDALPALVLKDIRSFAGEICLSQACRATLAATHELHYKVDMRYAWGRNDFDAAGHMGVQQTGGLATGRVVTRITVTNCFNGTAKERGYTTLEDAVKRVVRDSIPTLRSISVNEERGSSREPGFTGRARVAPIIGELVPVSSKKHRVAPRLTRVALSYGSTGVAKVGKAIAAGLWPALEKLSLSHCRANAGHFMELAHGLSTGRAPNLRVLYWGYQSFIREKSVDNVILSALSARMCPLIERLSFTDNLFCPEYRIGFLRDALRACPSLRELSMDCSRQPHNELRALTDALQAGYAPNLENLFVRATAPLYSESDIALKALRQATAARRFPVHLESRIKTRLPPPDTFDT